MGQRSTKKLSWNLPKAWLAGDRIAQGDARADPEGLSQKELFDEGRQKASFTALVQS